MTGHERDLTGVAKDVSRISRAPWTKSPPLFTWAVREELPASSTASRRQRHRSPLTTRGDHGGTGFLGLMKLSLPVLLRPLPVVPVAIYPVSFPGVCVLSSRGQASGSPRSSLWLTLKNRARVQPRVCCRCPPVGAPQTVCSPTGRARPPSQGADHRRSLGLPVRVPATASTAAAV